MGGLRLGLWLANAVLGASLVVAGCATPGVLGPATSLEVPEPFWIPEGTGYFLEPDPRDPWTAPVANWQWRSRADAAAPSPVSAGTAPVSPGDAGGDSLAEAFEHFRAERRRRLASDVADWIQEQARTHFIPDGAVDRWPTFEETLARGGDDCDGLALVAYRLLRELGFDEGEIYQAIVYKLSDGQHHMVTLWFEDREDPWVIDPTAAMVGPMVRMSQVPDWRPIKIFSEREEYSVRLPTDDTPSVAAPPASD